MGKSTETTPIIRESMPPARTAEARENQLVSMAYDLVEERIKNGTVTGQELLYLMKRGNKKEALEQEILELQKDLIAAKTEAIQSAARVEELYSNAITALRGYQGGMMDE